MSYKFPYFENRPHIPIALEIGGKRVRFLPLFDTGADYCLFSESDAKRLDLNISDGALLNFNNADGSEFEAAKFELGFDIEGTRFKAPVCFVKDKYFSMPVLGRKGVFEKFIITINEADQLIHLSK